MWKIRIAIEKEPTKEDPAPFRWAQIKQKFKEEPETRKWVKENLMELVNNSKIKLHHFDK